MSALGHSLPMHSAPMLNNVRFAPKATVSHIGKADANAIWQTS